MPLALHVDVVSAEALIFSGKAERVIAPSAMGEIGILPRHTPLLARLKPGSVRVALDSGREESFFVSGGFIEVQPYIVTILADTAIRSKDLDEAAARAAKERLEKEMDGRQLSAGGYARLKAELQLAAALLRTIEELRGKKGKR